MRVAGAKADLVLGCDMMVAASPPALATMAPGRTKVLANTYLAPNAQFVLDPVHADFGEETLRDALVRSVGAWTVSNKWTQAASRWPCSATPSPATC